MRKPVRSIPTLPTPPGARIVGGVFGFIFAGIGLTVIIFLWSQPFDSFHSPPLFFRIFGSFIALAFIVMGGAMGIGTLLGGRRGAQDPAAWAASMQEQLGDSAGPADAREVPKPGRYVCNRCGAPLGEKADVSPLGDTRCIHCGSWFNVHGRTG